MDSKEMTATALALVAPGKGILAADESTPTITKRFKLLTCPRRKKTAAPTGRCFSLRRPWASPSAE